MEKQVALTLDEILTKEFSVDFKGYSPMEVDQFLDTVMGDYKTYQDLVTELKDKIAEQEEVIASLKEKLVEAEGEIRNAEANHEALQQEMVANSQVDILKRIARLEQAVFNSQRRF